MFCKTFFLYLKIVPHISEAMFGLNPRCLILELGGIVKLSVCCTDETHLYIEEKYDRGAL
jgi:hypothetical protein